MAEPPTKRISWHTLVIVALTVGLVWWFLSGLDFSRVWREMTQARAGHLVLAFVATVLTYFFRAWRWMALLQPIGPTRFRPTFRATVIGFAANFMLPGRVGEFLRPYLLARSEGFSAVSALATVIVERVLDVAVVVMLFAWFLLTQDVRVDAEGGAALEKATWGGIVLAAASGLGLLLLAIGAGHPERLERVAGRLLSRLPPRIGAGAARAVRMLAEGLAVMRRPAALAAAFGLTVLLWLSIAATIWLGSLAFGLTFSFTGSFLVLAFLTVGVSVPTPAGVGGFHAFYQNALVWVFRADSNVAAASAIVLHALTVIPVCIVGLVYMAQDGLSLRRLHSMRSTAEQAKELT